MIKKPIKASAREIRQAKLVIAALIKVDRKGGIHIDGDRLVAILTRFQAHAKAEEADHIAEQLERRQDPSEIVHAVRLAIARRLRDRAALLRKDAGL